MKHLTRRSLAPLIIVLALFASAAWTVPGCAPPPPNLTPAGAVAFRNLQAIKTLDLIRDLANDGYSMTPPVFSESSMVAVVKWHKATITTMNAATEGWQAAAKTALDEVVKNLKPNEAAIIGPYVPLTKMVIDQIP
jgi:hypothetical protein